MANVSTKICTRCKTEKSISEYYPRKTKAGNPSITSKCQNCCKEDCAIRNKAKRDSRPKNIITDLEGEVWKIIPNLEDRYMISNMGRVKSLDRWVYRKVAGKDVFMEGQLMKHTFTVDGYAQIVLYANKKKNAFGIHRLVFANFIQSDYPKGYEVDHIDNNKTNNKVTNLQLLKARQNSTKRSMNLKKTSRFTGVHWSKTKSKWHAHIRIGGKTKYLGRYENEIDASIAYQKALQSLENKAA